jgi:hypothetical protein
LDLFALMFGCAHQYTNDSVRSGESPILSTALMTTAMISTEEVKLAIKVFCCALIDSGARGGEPFFSGQEMARHYFTVKSQENQ